MKETTMELLMLLNKKNKKMKKKRRPTTSRSLISCSSPASTAICRSVAIVTAAASSVAIPAAACGMRRSAIDRHNPHVVEDRRRSRRPTVDITRRTATSPAKSKPRSINKAKDMAAPQPLKTPLFSHYSDDSARYLLSDTGVSFSDADQPKAAITAASKNKEAHHVASSSSSSSSWRLLKQHDDDNNNIEAVVVVLKVSLHCKGCEAKVRKHISKMQGVTWFGIDMAAKKVTVVGDVTPLGVLNSISKVKNAQFWG